LDNNSHKDIELQIDVNLISKLLDIVLDNAVKFSKHNEIIEIADNIVENFYEISVIDHGEGFSDETLANLFNFFSADELIHHSKGFGLGLAAAKMITNLHKGKIMISNNPDMGSKVTLRLMI